MNRRRIRRLLDEPESNTLDFKREQYRLITDEDKGEFIKDILAFANAPRAKDAHIIIGVSEEPRPPHALTGIAEPLHDHHLQQLVNTKLNRPVAFSYQALELDGVVVGVITILRSQHPPHHLTRDFGKLRKDTVYIRHGSSTAIATPDEIRSLSQPKRQRARAKPSAAVRTLEMAVMYRHDEMVTIRAGRGIPGFEYTPPREHRFSLGEYLRLKATLLITPTAPLVIVSALSTAILTTADGRTTELQSVKLEPDADTIDIAGARTIRVRGDHRVTGDVLAASRADGISVTISLTFAPEQLLQLHERLTWDNKAEAFTR